MIINNSRLEEFQRCARRYYWANLYGGTGLVSRNPPTALKFGELVHDALALQYATSASVPVSMQNFDKLLDWDNLPFDLRNQWVGHKDLISRILHEYYRTVRVNDLFKVVAVEQEFIVPIGDICYSCGVPYPQDITPDMSACAKCNAGIHFLAGKVDLAYEENNAVKIMDHKTASSASDKAKWEYSMQMLGYVYGFRRKHPEAKVTGYTVNILLKQETIGTEKRDTKNCPACKNGVKKKIGCTGCDSTGKVEKVDVKSPFIRQSYSLRPSDEDRLVLNRLQTIERIESEGQKPLDAAYPMAPASCFQYGPCPFLKLCWDGADALNWYEKKDYELADYAARSHDYVTLIQEEVR